MIICDKSDCTGCSACASACHQNCISIELNEEGFYKYNIDETKCVECGMCKRVCPSLNYYVDIPRLNPPSAYLCWNNKHDVRLKSSSGGLFRAFSEAIISDGGVVFGVKFDAEFNAVHTEAYTFEELNGFYGSKYIQSKMGGAYLKVKKMLTQSKTVFFEGTPCQVAGLYNFLGKDYDGLITCDIVCHGVSSVTLQRNILDYYENKYGSKVKALKYRDKNKGWSKTNTSVQFESGRIINKPRNASLLTYGYVTALSVNTTCNHCNHSKIPRRADITIADYAGSDSSKYGKQGLRSGLSLLLINSSKGQDFIFKISDNLYLEKKNLSYILKKQKNIYMSNYGNTGRESFFSDYINYGFAYVKRRYLRIPVKQKVFVAIGYKNITVLKEHIKKVLRVFGLRK